MRKKTILTGLLTFIFVGLILATTWLETTITCPVCKTTNKFMTWGSYGGYIYGWPSKYQYIYWPVTETYSIYSCKKCRYTAFMWDFVNVSGDTLEMIKNAIDTLQIDMISKKDYTKIPTSEKLETAELFYKLYNKDQDFWCKFYRIKGYHYDIEKLKGKANESRIIAIHIAENLLSDSSNNYRIKELLLISGAMKHFIGDDSLALIDFEKAKGLEYINPKSDSSNNAGVNNYIDKLLDDYIHLLNSPDEQ